MSTVPLEYPEGGVDYPDELDAKLEKQGRKIKAFLRVAGGMDFDFDREIYDGVLRQSDAKSFRVADIDAKLIEGDYAKGNYNVQHYKTLRDYYASPYFRKYVSEQQKLRRLSETKKPDNWEKLSPNQKYRKFREGTFDTAPIP